MACGCGGTKNAKMHYQWTSPTGTTKTYTTQVEAEAAKIRGGGGSVRAVAR